jgi:hypothetical protein
MKSLKLLAEQYEFIHVKNIIEEASAEELIEAFELANYETPNIKDVLVAINNGSLFINESELTDDEQTFFSAATKLVTFYKENVNAEYNTRFESLISDAQARDASGRFVKGSTGTAAPAPAAATAASPAGPAAATGGGWMSKVGGFLGRVGKGIAKGIGSLAGSFLKGFAGSEGKSKDGKAIPGWEDTSVKVDLSSIASKTTAFTPEQLTGFGVSPDTIKKIQDGKLAGLNLTDEDNNLVSVKYQNGQYIGTKIPTFKQAADAGAADPAAKAAADKAAANPVATTPAPVAAAAPVAADPAAANPVATTPAPVAAPVAADPAAAAAPVKKAKPLSQDPEAIRSRKRRAAGTLKESSFNYNANKILREFYQNSKPLPIESINKQ